MDGLNGAATHKVKDTVFVALPRAAWRSCGRCDCPTCKGGEGFWDTLAVAANGDGRAWTVHYPEFSGNA